MTIDDATIRDLIGFEDATGVLSVYTGFTPSRAADPQPTAPIEIRNQLRALRADLAVRDADLARAVDERIDTIAPELDRLLDPRSPGRGRALFVGVDSGRTETVTVQLPFRERAVLHDGPFVRPLVAAHDEGRAAGIVVLSRAGGRLLRWQVGEVEELETRGFEVPEQVLADEKAGPSVGNPEHPHHGFVDRDRFEDRVDANRQRSLRAFAEDVQAAAKQHGWDRVVVSSLPKLREPIEDVLRNNGSVRVLTTDAAWEDATPHAIAEQVWPLLRSVHLDRELELVTGTVERALGGAVSVVGLRHVCAALNEGRVKHLLFDDALSIEGYRSEDGSLHPRVEGLVAEAGLEFTREPLFIERLVERAIATGAQVTPLEPTAAAHLADHEGVAAKLRW